MKFAPILAFTAASAQSAAIIADPLLALVIGILLALLGVTSAWMATPDEPFRLRFMMARYMAALIVAPMAFGFARLAVNEHLIMIGVAGVSGLMLDLTMLIIERQLRKRGGLDEQ